MAGNHAVLGRALALAALAAAGPAGAQADCRLCAAPPATPAAGPGTAPRESARPLRIDIESMLDFSRIASVGTSGGEVKLDAQTGQRQVQGAVTGLGGMAMRGTVRITGEPGRALRIDLPIRVQLRSTTGATAEITGIETDLPPSPRLDMQGELRFAFGGRLSVKGAVSGTFRGSIPITADYQ